MEYKKEYGYFKHMCLNLTDSCNCLCRYCFVAQKPNYMSLQVAKDAVDYLMKNMEHYENEKAEIVFFGGEPLLMWNSIILPLVEYVENKYPDKANFSMTTNGTLLDKDKIDYLVEHNIYILLSIDGNKEVQDFNRPLKDGGSSFDLVIKNIPYLLEKFPNLTFRATIYPESVEHTFESYLFAAQQGFQDIFFCTDSRSTWSEEQLQLLEQEVAKICTFILGCFIHNKPFPHMQIIDDSLMFLYKKDTLPIEIKRDIFRCGLGTTTAAIGYDGTIYGCQEQPSRENNIFCIGNIYDGINEEAHQKLLEEYNKLGVTSCSNKDECHSCPLRLHCQFINCPSTSYDLYKDTLISPQVYCRWSKYFYTYCLLLNNILTINNNEYFKKYMEENVSWLI